MAFIKNNEINVGDTCTTTRIIKCCCGYFEKGTKVKVTGITERGYDLEDFEGNEIGETGFDSVELLDNENELNIGDLVETCALMPGFVIWINPSDKDDIEVQAFDKLDKYTNCQGSSHSVKHCGVHKISQFRAMCLCALGNERLNELYNDDTFDYYNDKVLYNEVLKLRSNN